MNYFIVHLYSCGATDQGHVDSASEMTYILCLVGR